MSVLGRLPGRSARRLAGLAALILVGSGLDAVVTTAGPMPTVRAAAATAPKDVTARPDRTSALLAARLVGHRVQISGESTESSNTYANADGTFTLEAGAGPLQVRRGEAWLPVDTTLAVVAGRVAPKVVPHAVSFSAGGTGPLVNASDKKGRKLSLSWPSGLPAPTLAGDTATYPNVVAGGDLLLLATREGWEVSLRLRARPAGPLVINIPMTYAGLTLTQNADKSLVWKTPAGAQVATSPAPIMFDGAIDPDTGNPARMAAVTSAVVNSGKTLRLTPDPAFLADPATVYPVIVDPSTNFAAAGGAYVDSGFPTTSYYNPTELKIGTYNGGANKLRSYLSFAGRVNVAGKHVLSAYLSVVNRYSYSCTARPTYVRAMSGSYSSATTWNTQPTQTTQYGTKSFAHGYSSSCPSAYESIEITGLVAGWASGAITTQQLALTASETDNYGWKKFNSPQSGSGVPAISVTYNTKPGPAGSSTTSPSVVTGGTRFTSSATPTLSGKAIDPDGNTVQHKDEVWAWNGTAATGTAPVTSAYIPFVASGATASWTVSPALVNGTTYAWRAAVFDGTDYNGTWSPWQPFTVDTTVPTTPTVTSSTFPATWTDQLTSGTVTISATDPGGAISGYQYQLDGAGAWTASTATISLTDLSDVQHSLAFRAVDRAGNLSEAGTLILNAGGLASPADQARTQAQVSLQATPTAPAGRPWVSYQWRTDTTAAYAGLGGTNVVGGATWPEQPVSGAYPAHVWNIATDAGHDGLVQVRACYGATAGDSVASLQCAAPSNVQIATTNFGAAAATTAAGPGSLALLTGDYQVSVDDVNVPSYNGSLTVGRSLTTLAPSTITTGAEGVFGPGWTASLPGPDAGAADLTLTDQSAQGYAILTDPEGAEDLYVVRGGDPNSFDGHGDATDGSVLHKDNSTQFTLTDSDGTKTVWTKTGTLWGVSAVIEPGSDSTTTYTRDTSGRVTQILAPIPAGVTCTTPSTTAGCRTLALTYATATTATATVPGDYTGRLQQITFTAYNPQTSAMATVEVAHYAYDTTGHLREAWDPRISPVLKTGYTYDANGRLATLTPPGLAAWTLNYDVANRMSTITRPDPTGPTATTTITYGVPLTGDAALPDLSATQADRWGQRDVPTKATAIFGPDHVPAGAPAAADWPYASVSYLDVNGRQTNTASYGAGAWQLSTTEYDKHGNTIRTLSAGNRAEALTPTADTDPYVAVQADSAERADLLATLTTFSDDGVDQTDSWGPMHPIVLDDGSTLSGRAHTHTDYDQGAPATGGPYRLPTTATSSVTPAAGADVDAKVTTTGYDPVVTGDTPGWTLRQATTSTTVLAGAATDIVNTTRFNAQGQSVESRMPADTAGTGAGTSLTTYYTAGATSGCVNTALAGLLCKAEPKAQPAGKPLPTITTTYNVWQQPLVATETYGTTGVTRTSTTTYDGAGRPVTSAITVNPAADGGTAVPTVTTGYSTTTGLPTTTSTAGGTITTGYDNLGRVISYTDADANTTTTTYDISGRPVTVNDGKGSTTYTYDSASEHRGLLTGTTDSQAGTFTASYDPDGSLTSQAYPGGLTATSIFDNAGNPTRLDYTKSGTSWASFTNTSDTDGKVRTAASPGSTQTHRYDDADRLAQTDDTTGGTCIRGSYAFNAPTGLNSNRTDSTSTDGLPGTAGDCDLTGATPTTTSRSYDTADRLTDTGYTYDTLGRTLTVPGADAASPTDNLTVGYHANDLVRTQSQAGRTITFSLDPADRLHTQTDSTTSKTQTQHYTDSSDSPAWTEVSDGTWTRNVAGCGGDLAAITKPDGSVELQITNLHGDVVAVTAPADTTGYSTYFESTEYGTPRPTNPSNPKYAWLGAKQRSADALGGLTLMGVRLYNPATGRFLSVDPVPGGSANNYDYCTADPINCTDLDGRWSSRKWWRRAGHGVRAYRNARLTMLAVGYAYMRGGSCRRSSGLMVNCEGVRGANGKGGFVIGNTWMHKAKNSEYSRKDLKRRQRHEARHSTQWAILGGSRFIGAYSADWLIHRGKRKRMWMERAADLGDGGY